MVEYHLFHLTYKTGPQADTHTHTNEKKTQSSLLDPPADERETSWGSEFGGYLTVGGRACPAMRHLTKVVGPVPSRTWGTRGSWQSLGGE